MKKLIKKIFAKLGYEIVAASHFQALHAHAETKNVSLIKNIIQEKNTTPIAIQPSSEKGLPKYFLIISNMRSGSTWLQTMLGTLGDVVTDYELKWKPEYDLEKMHIFVDEQFSFKPFFDKLGSLNVKGSKLTFDFFKLNEIDKLLKAIPSDVAIIHLTRDYFEIINSFHRGIFHNYNDNSSLELKSPTVHNALLQSNKIFETNNHKISNEKKKEVSLPETEEYLNIFLSVDKFIHKLSLTNPYIRVDYSEVKEKFEDLVTFIGSTENKQKICSVLESPPTIKLPTEIVISNDIQVRNLANKYKERKTFTFNKKHLYSKPHAEYKVQTAMVQLSGVCNYQCRMCGHPDQNHGFMSNEIFEKIIKNCKQSKIHTLIFAGAWGEPTLHPDWQRFLKQSVNSGFNTILSTNASRLDIDAINFLATSGLKTLQISFAGFDKQSYEETYIKGNFNAIKEVLVSTKKIFKSVSNAPQILINGVIMNDKSADFIDKTYRFLYECGYSNDEINMVRPNNYGGKIAEGNSLKYKAKSNLQLCSVLRDVVGIYWDGRVSACACLDNDGKMIIGNILEESITDMRKSKKFCRILKCFAKKDLASLEMCSKCDVPYGDERNVRLLPSWS